MFQIETQFILYDSYCHDSYYQSYTSLQTSLYQCYLYVNNKNIQTNITNKVKHKKKLII